MMIVLGLSSCEAVNNLIHDDEVVAKVGSHRLYRSDLEGVVPMGVSGEDSVLLVRDFIERWADEEVLLDIADAQLSKEEKDVTRELEEYRRSLLRYRFEQNYVNARLDTVVSRSEIQKYYTDHKDRFVLEVPIVKAKLVVMMKDSPNLEEITRLMSSSKSEDISLTDSLAYSSALKFTGFGGAWTDMTTIAEDYGVEYKELLSKMKDSYIKMEDENGRVIVTYISEMMKAGEAGPVEYSSQLIRDIIISGRKHQLLQNLEQELLEGAKANDEIVIY